MALISKIRKNSWVLIALIGLGLGAFIMMDMFNSNTGAFANRSTMDIATVNGDNISYDRFNRAERILFNGSSGNTFGQRESLWNFFIEESILKQEGEKLGLTVGTDELMELQFGTKLSPIVQNSFRGQNGQVDRTRLNEFKTAIENRTLKENNPNAYYYWAEQEDQIIKDRLQSKMVNLISKGMFTPSWMVENLNNEKNQKLNFNYVKIPFSEVDDSSVEVSDTDLSSYLNSNAALYTTEEEQRRIDYVTFDVFPTRADSAAIRKNLSELKSEFANAPSDSAFVVENNGEYLVDYFKKAKLSPAVSELAYSNPVGTVLGPYVDGAYYKLAKVLDKKIIPDSVKAQHILISANQADPNSYGVAFGKADSILTVINSGGSFNTLAEQHSDDKSNSAKGGDLGYFAQGAMVKPFNDAAFFTTAKGEIATVATQFGVHLVKVNDFKFLGSDPSVQIAYVTKSIIPSEATQSAIEERAQNFVNENETMDALVALANEDAALNIESSPALKANDYQIGSLGQDAASRDMVRWAFEPDTESGDLSPDIFTYQFSNPVTFETYNSKFVVAALKNIQNAGRPEVSAIRSDIEDLVRNEKKSALIKTAVANLDMNQIASKYSTQVDSLSAVSVSSSFIPGLGTEPKVLAAASNLAENQVSSPIVGDNGVYIVLVTGKTNSGAAANIAQLRKEESSRIKTMANQNLLKAMCKEAEIEDNRYNFY